MLGLGRVLGGRTIVRPALGDMFPIVDAASAHLMKIKAQCLFVAGVITATQKARVDDAADHVIAPVRHSPPIMPAQHLADLVH